MPIQYTTPFEQEMNAAFLFTAVCLTLWWNLQWKRVMRFWLKPPYRRRTEVLFRIFFAVCFLGSIGQFVGQLFSHPLGEKEAIAAAKIAAIMCAVVAVMSASVLWMAQKRDAIAAARSGSDKSSR